MDEMKTCVLAQFPWYPRCSPISEPVRPAKMASEAIAFALDNVLKGKTRRLIITIPREAYSRFTPPSVCQP